MALKTITLTAADIKGSTRTGDNNPIVRAIRRELKKPPEIYMATWQGRLQIGRTLYNLPPECDAWEVAHWCRGLSDPLEFQIDNTPAGGFPPEPAPTKQPTETQTSLL